MGRSMKPYKFKNICEVSGDSPQLLEELSEKGYHLLGVKVERWDDGSGVILEKFVYSLAELTPEEEG